MKRGHSNVYAKNAEPWPAIPQCARVPLCGGSTVQSVKDLPPLALHRDDWEEIGRRMGWLKPAKKRQTNDATIEDGMVHPPRTRPR